MKIEKGEDLKKDGKPKAERVKELQTELKKTGLYKGAVNGKFDDATDKAVRAFQKKFHLEEDGQAGPDFGSALNAFVSGLQQGQAGGGADNDDKPKNDKPKDGLDGGIALPNSRELEKEQLQMKKEIVERLKGKREKQDDKTPDAERLQLEEELYKWRKRLIDEIETMPKAGESDGGDPQKSGSSDQSGLPPDPPPPGDSRAEREAFARAVQDQLAAYLKKNDCCNLDPCTLVAQWMAESFWGRAGLAKVGKNLGGIKGVGTAGSYESPTQEEIGGRKVTIKGRFRRYNNFPEFYADYCKLICTTDRYKDARGKKGKAYYQALKDAGYATDSSYVDLCNSLYKQLCKD